jgi:hypothetical protein
MVQKTVHTPASLLYQWLINNELAGDPEITSELWPVYINFQPDKPDNLIVVTDSGGRIDGRGHNSKKSYKHPAVQLLVRARRDKEPEAYEKIFELDEKLDELVRETVVRDEDFAYQIKSVSKTTPITALGRSQESDRPSFSVNLLVDYMKVEGS